MAYPAGVVTTQLTFGTAQAMIGQDALAMTVKITPTTNLVYGGNVFIADTKVIQVAAGGSGAVTLINPDQPGFFNGGGLAIRNWGYTFEITYTNASSVAFGPITKLLTWFASDAGPLDVDTMVPIADGSGILVPATSVASAISQLASTTDAAVSGLLTSATTTRNALDARYAQRSSFGFYPLSGTGIDPTGATDSTSAVNTFFAALPANASVVTPSASVIQLTGTINISKKVHWSGRGELRWVSGIGGGGSSDVAMVSVTADGCNFDGLYMTNPSRAFSDTGGKTIGIYVNASYTRVAECTIVGQQNAILEGANGDWHHTIVKGNFVLDVPGGGAEDRGDGITIMGAAGQVLGNTVSAYESTTNNPRIGIATEGLPVYETFDYLYKDSMILVVGNVVTGPFKRSITSEGTVSCQILSNTVSGSTVWGINVVNLSGHNVVADNTITMTYMTGDTRGNDLSPIRCGIMVYDNVDSTIVHDNTIRMKGSGKVSGIVVQNGNAPSTDVDIHHNVVDGLSGVKIDYGVLIPSGSLRTRVNDNKIKNFSITGVHAVGADEVEICRNMIRGSGSTTIGIHTEGSGINGKFDKNDIKGVGTSIQAFFRTGLVSVSDNLIDGAATGVDTFGLTAPAKLKVSGNQINATTQFANVPASGGGLTVLVVNNQ